MKDRGERADKTGNLRKGPKSPEMTSGPPKLSDLGISKNESSRWQKLANLDEGKFEVVIVESREKADRLGNVTPPTLGKFAITRTATVSPTP
jgi:hypothetical protein